MMDSSGSKICERRTALVGRELAKYSGDIGALRETWLANMGRVTEFGPGYTFVWSRRTERVT